MGTPIDWASYTRAVMLTRSSRNGTRAFGPFTVPVGITQIGIAIDITTDTDPTKRWDLILEFSNDGGVSWNPYAPWPQGCGRSGGVTRDEAAVAIPEAAIFRSLPEPANALRQLRGSITVVGPISLAVSILVK